MVQYGAYQRLLAPGLRATEIAVRRRALTRWFTFAVVWQVIVLVAIAAYGLYFHLNHPPGLGWIGPPVAAVIGTAFPLQIAVWRIARASRV